MKFGVYPLGLALAALPRVAFAEAETPPASRAEQGASTSGGTLDDDIGRTRPSAVGALSSSAPGEPRLERSWTVPALHGLGLFVTLRLTEAYLYPDPFAETRWSVLRAHYVEAFTRPPKFDSRRPAFEWDGDPWHINVVGHALMGSELYLRARTCGQGPLESLAFTGAGAVVWDYAFEGNGVRPSAFDLVYTPAAGIALGELRYWVWSSSRNIETPFVRSLVRGLFDPLGEVERWAGTPC